MKRIYQMIAALFLAAAIFTAASGITGWITRDIRGFELGFWVNGLIGCAALQFGAVVMLVIFVLVKIIGDRRREIGDRQKMGRTPDSGLLSPFWEVY